MAQPRVSLRRRKNGSTVGNVRSLVVETLVRVGIASLSAVEEQRAHRLVVPSPVSLENEIVASGDVPHQANARIECLMPRCKEPCVRGVGRSQPSRPPSVPQPRRDREIRHDREIILDEYSGILYIRIDPDLSAPRARRVNPAPRIKGIDRARRRIDIGHPCQPAIPCPVLLPSTPRILRAYYDLVDAFTE